MKSVFGTTVLTLHQTDHRAIFDVPGMKPIGRSGCVDGHRPFASDAGK
jgi:hypothetical protein